jgi:NADP-dependent 3-hydroxy acid dehydrogenase YdfG
MEMRSLLKDEVVVVTGATQDNRRAIAPGMAGAGAKVVVADVNWDGVKAVTHEIESLGSAALPFALDVKDRNASSRFAQASKAGSDLPQSWLTIRASSAARLSMLLPTMRIAN